MAESSSGQEKSEDASPKRLDEARKKGDVARSKELNTVLGLLIGMLGLAIFAPGGVAAYQAMAKRQWRIERNHVFETEALLNSLYEPMMAALWIIAPFLALTFLAAFAGPMLMGGWVFSISSWKFDVGKLNPLKGLKRMVGQQGLAELVKALIKVVMLGFVAYLVLKSHVDDYLILGQLALGPALQGGFVLIFKIIMILLLVLVFVAVIDVPYQKFTHAQKLRMTKQEVREESKETNGNPEIKNKLRSLQQSVSQRRMLLDVPDADVIIVNPTHYAVALQYREDESAPKVLAKGVDHLAMRIREIAKQSDVPVFSAPVLARALHRHAEVGESIPTELYLAVAQVLAYIFQVQRASFDIRRRLQVPTDLPVPDSMRNLDKP